MYDGENIQDYLDDQAALSIDIILFDGSIGSGNFSDLISRISNSSTDYKALVLTDPLENYYWESQHRLEIEGTLPKNSKKTEFEKKIRSLISHSKLYENQ